MLLADLMLLGNIHSQKILNWNSQDLFKTLMQQIFTWQFNAIRLGIPKLDSKTVHSF